MSFNALQHLGAYAYVCAQYLFYEDCPPVPRCLCTRSEDRKFEIGMPIIIHMNCFLPDIKVERSRSNLKCKLLGGKVSKPLAPPTHYIVQTKVHKTQVNSYSELFLFL